MGPKSDGARRCARLRITSLSPVRPLKDSSRGGCAMRLWAGILARADMEKVRRVLFMALAGWVLAAWMLIAGCDRVTASKVAAAPPPPTVVVAPVLVRDTPIVRDFVGRTEAVPTVEIRARVAGVLEQVRFREGSEVKKGQVLFVIQPDEYNAALQAAQAQLAKAQADLTRARDVSIADRGRAHLDQAKAELEKARMDVARYRPLAQEKAIPQQDLDSAVSRQQVAVAGVEAAEAAFKDTVLAQRTAIQLAEAAVESGK